MIEFNVNQRVNRDKKVIKITTIIKFDPDFCVGIVVKFCEGFEVKAKPNGGYLGSNFISYLI